ncbi:hypothetical protein DIPPA_17571 [Diplonema papillatum]|nr:hypothetical protein DIPPA_17571 [Diplonema papillatum]
MEPPETEEAVEVVPTTTFAKKRKRPCLRKTAALDDADAPEAGAADEVSHVLRDLKETQKSRKQRRREEAAPAESPEQPPSAAKQSLDYQRLLLQQQQQHQEAAGGMKALGVSFAGATGGLKTQRLDHEQQRKQQFIAQELRKRSADEPEKQPPRPLADEAADHLPERTILPEESALLLENSLLATRDDKSIMSTGPLYEMEEVALPLRARIKAADDAEKAKHEALALAAKSQPADDKLHALLKQMKDPAFAHHAYFTSMYQSEPLTGEDRIPEPRKKRSANVQDRVFSTEKPSYK